MHSASIEAWICSSGGVRSFKPLTSSGRDEVQYQGRDDGGVAAKKRQPELAGQRGNRERGDEAGSSRRLRLFQGHGRGGAQAVVADHSSSSSSTVVRRATKARLCFSTDA